jgi:hypothetical protein
MLHWGQQQQLLQCCIHPLGMGPLVLAYPYSNQQAHLHLWQGNAGTHRIRLQLTSKIGSLGRFQGLFLTCMCLHSYTHVLSLQAKSFVQSQALPRNVRWLCWLEQALVAMLRI